MKADLSDLIEKVRWAQTHDDQVKQIGLNGRRYAADHLLPKDIICYHVLLLKVHIAYNVSPFTKVLTNSCLLFAC